MNLSKDLAVIVYLTQTKIDNLRIKAKLHVDDEMAIGLSSANSPESVNHLAKTLEADWLLIVSEHESVTRALGAQLNELRAQSPQTQLYFLQDDCETDLVEPAPSDFISQLFGISPFGMFINRQFLLELGGLSVEHTHAFDIELFLRCAKAGEARVASLPKSFVSNIDRQVTAAILGSERVVQVTGLVARELGYSSPYWFRTYVKLWEKLIGKGGADQLVLDSHKATVSAVGYQICKHIRPAEQYLLGPYLRRSVFDDGLVHNACPDVDDALLQCFGRTPERLRFSPGFRAFSMGATAQTAKLLKQLGMQRASGPFDWLKTSPEVAEHLLVDDFHQFLDPEWTKTQPKQGLAQAMQAREHGFYREQFKLQGMLPFHDLRIPRDLEFYTKSIELLRGRLTGNAPTCMVYLSTASQDAVLWRRLAAHLAALGKRNRLVVIRLTTNAIKPVQVRKWKNIVMADLVVQTLDEELSLSSASDSVRFVRLLHGLCLGFCGQALIDESAPDTQLEQAAT